ncbi:hypothetical protein CYD26_04905 [Pseudomonas sp. FFUP_PS_473]|uniref:toxin-antitoxin system YwqK family antitoxin n=1 Tax=Pseudomonas sp. FFUP_PS_473 TaxID=2060418 RepID=UPI000C79D856|nr:hypothetical protein [Pseudomonas sp. FFUP_PS_473]PLP95195.1 hypothetical protein CYD26_04905 [Pseudomonas sp. FFUP_PS_473]
MFKKIAASLLVAGSVLLAGCGKSIEFRNTEIVNGAVYEKGANQPLTGEVTNFPERLLAFQVGHNDLLDTLNRLLNLIGNTTDGLLGQNLLCTIKVDEGRLDGPVTCFTPRSTLVRYQARYAGGTFEGETTVFSHDGKRTLAKGHLKGGLLDGELEVLHPETGKPLYRAEYKDNQTQGTIESFSAKTGKRVLSAGAVAGKYNGQMQRFTEQGQLIYRGTYADGAKVGLHEEFYPDSGKPSVSAEWANGQLNGVVKQWNAQGTLVEEATYKDGVKVVARPTARAAGSDDCVSKMAAEYRKEAGAGAVVRAGMLDEWAAMCRQL